MENLAFSERYETEYSHLILRGWYPGSLLLCPSPKLDPRCGGCRRAVTAESSDAARYQ